MDRGRWYAEHEHLPCMSALSNQTRATVNKSCNDQWQEQLDQEVVFDLTCSCISTLMINHSLMQQWQTTWMHCKQQMHANVVIDYHH